MTRRFLLALGALLVGALLFAGPASAHATLVASTPQDGARLAAVPAAVTLSFDEPVGLGGLGYLHVTDARGRRVESGPATHPGGDGTRVTVHLRAGLGDGTYIASYRVVSADSHPVSGVVRFVVGNGPLAAAAVGSGGGGSDAGAAAALDAGRWISYAGFALLGGAWLLLTVWPAGRDERRARRLVWVGWGLAASGAVAELLLEGVYGAGRPVLSALSPSLVDATLHGDYGQLHSARLVLLGALAVVLGRALQPVPRRALRDDAYWPLMIGVAYTFSAAGHATTTRPSWLSIPADMLHLLAMSAWVGGLAVVAVALLPRREPQELRETLPAFSTAAFASVAVLAATGTYAAWRGVGSWRALVHTEYGLLVLGKVAAFGGLLLLGNLSRRIIQARVRRPAVAFAMTSVPAAAAGAPGGPDEVDVERMRRSVLVELVVAGAVLALTAVLVSQPRGSEALAAQDRHPVSVSAPLGGGADATVTVDPGVHGPVSISVTGTGAGRVTATASEPAAQLGPLPIPLTRDGAGYTAAGADLPVAGTWVITLVITRSEFDAVTTQARITLK